jgi:hypothetical protein
LKTVCLRPKILCGNLKKVVLGLDGKDSFKNGQKVSVPVLHPKKLSKMPLFGLLKMATSWKPLVR